MANQKRPRKRPSYEITPKVDLDFTIDSQKIEEIRKCLEKGKLTITLNKVDLTTIAEAGRAGDGYLYD